MSQSSAEFEVALRAHLHSKFLQTLPPHFLKLRVREFLQLATLQPANSVDSLGGETPRTATRRSVRQGTISALSSITKSVKRSLFSLATPSKPPKSSVASTPSNHAAVPPQTPHHMTIKSTIKTAGASVSKPHANSPSRRHASQTPRSRHKQVPAQTPRSQTIHQAASPGTSTGIVQFQLHDGQIVDVDFSRSPQSALQEANLLGSEAIGEVKAKIETYANQFMQYIKFFKKFKPT